jgi:hypothetical protein
MPTGVGSRLLLIAALIRVTLIVVPPPFRLCRCGCLLLVIAALIAHNGIVIHIAHMV